NDQVGSTHTKAAAEAVVAHGAHLGISLDGDADRVMILDETGRVADGDQIMALLASRWAEEGRLKGGTLVATVMSNLGLERFLTGRGLRLERTAVGDRYVVEAMRRGGWNLGGEQSGHIVMTDYATTGDGLIAGLQFLAEMARTGQAASRLVDQFQTVPQLLQNIRYPAGSKPLDAAAVQATISANEQRIAGKGRILIRKSGTEPLIRVMAECEDADLLADVVQEIVAAVEKATRTGA
ncbi:MAG: phosphoglucosamine mutase, partial [Pseudomonadota bacterium]